MTLDGKANICSLVRAAINCKSGFSFLDSLLKPEEIVRLAVEAGCEALAVTDPNLHGAVELYQAGRESGLKVVIAAEVTVEGARWNAYVKNQAGYRNLCALLSLPVVERAVARAHGGGLIWRQAGWLPEVRYAVPEDAGMFAILQSIRTLTLLERRDGRKRSGAMHFPQPQWFDQMRPELAREIDRIVQACEFEYELGGLNFPHFRPPDGSTPRAFLRKLAMEGAVRRYGNPPSPDILLQLGEELAIIGDVGYEEYFLLTWSILEDCKRAGIEWITRGSAADSLVCYCLGISDVCPVRFDLYFRRFLNRDRMSLNKLPDIDLDFAHDRKDDVVDLIFRRYGEHAAVVGGFSTFQGRSAFAEIAKVLGVSEYQIRQMTRRIPHASAARVREVVAASQECRDLPLEDTQYQLALRLAERLDGMPRHAKMHPCGVVLSRSPVRELSPVFTSRKGYATTHFDMDSVEAVGWVKMDILAQGGLAVMRDAKKLLRERGMRVRMEDLRGWQDPEIWRMIAAGEARGVHHIESPAMTSLERMVGVDNIDDLIAIVSVIRPGAANSLKKTQFARRAQGLEAVEYAHPSLEPVLRSTYGVVAYEEHILQICEVFSGLAPGKADLLRRSLVKERMEKVEEIGREFVECARAMGRTEAEIEAVWQLVVGFRGYAFCRAHSTAYGVEAYEAAYLKRYHPAEFLACVLTHGKGFYSKLVYSLECRRLGMRFLSPDVNYSQERYFPEEAGRAVRPLTAVMLDGEGPPSLPQSRAIRVPLWQMNGLSEATLADWRSGRPFASMRDFYNRTCVSRDEMAGLIRVGAFDGFGAPRTEQFWEFQRLSQWPRSGAQCGLAGVEVSGAVPGNVLEEPGYEDRLRDEMELLGFTVSGHPLDLYPRVRWETYCPVARLGEYPGERVITCGMVVETRLHHQADGRMMKFFSLCDYTGILECEMFAGVYKKFGAESLRYPVLEVTGTVQPFDNGRGFTLQVERVAKVRREKVENRLSMVAV